MLRTIRHLLAAGAALLATLAALSAVSASAMAADATWTGGGATNDWSLAGNWAGGAVPTSPVGTLSFPGLGTCTATTCYHAEGDALGPLSVNELTIDDTVPYSLDGNEIDLAGNGLVPNVGLDTTPGTGTEFPEIGLPVVLSADQTWDINANTSGGRLQVNTVSGNHTLGVVFTNGAELDTSSLNTGAATLSGNGRLYVGPQAGVTPALPAAGVSIAAGTQLRTGAPSTTSGPISSTGGILFVGNGYSGDSTLNVTGDVSFDSASFLDMYIDQAGSGPSNTTVPSTDYSQLTASGTVALGNAGLSLQLGHDAAGACDDLVPGEVYTLVSAASVTGYFHDLNGDQIANGGTVTPGNPCDNAAPPTLTIAYTPTAVTATVASAGNAGDVPVFKTGVSPVPAISGTRVVGSALTASPGTWTGISPTYDYTWTSCSTPTACTTVGTDSAQYTPTNADVGNTMKVCITASNGFGSGIGNPCVVDSTAITTPPPPSNTSLPSLSGDAQSGNTLLADPGTWNEPVTYSYQWQQCTSSQATTCVNVNGATSISYPLTDNDVDKYVRVAVTATGVGPSSTTADSPTSAEVVAAAPTATTPTTTTPTTTTPTTTPTATTTTPSTSQIRSELGQIGHPSGKKAIAALVKSGAFRVTFKAKAGGMLTVVWTTTVTTGTGTHKKHKTVTIATGTTRAGSSGTVHLTIRLTASGRALLKTKLTGIGTTATEKFKPGGRNWVSVTKKFSL